MIDKIEIREIVSSDRHFSSEIIFREETGFFEGHFPDFPLLPGVLQVHFAIRLFEKYQGKKISFAGLKSVKFFKPIFPGKTIFLECIVVPEKGHLNFHYHSSDQTFSKGVILVKNV